MSQVVEFLEEELPNIVALSEHNPAVSIQGFFEAYMQSSMAGSSMSSVIEEEDILFLEKIALESWRFLGGNTFVSGVAATTAGRDARSVPSTAPRRTPGAAARTAVCGGAPGGCRGARTWHL